MPQFGLIGNPIDHSLSPKMFQKAYGNRFQYKLIERRDFESSWKRFIDAYDGINVTAPYKEPAFEKADMVTPECVKTGAANLVLKSGDITVAYNSDYRGIKLIMESIAAQDGKDFKGKNALVIGCGGAGKAAAVALLDTGMKLAVINRTRDKAQRFCEHLYPEYGEIPFAGIAETVKAFEWADVVVYALPWAIPQIYDIASAKGKLVIEANYRKCSFDKALVGKLGCELVSGRQWLAYQAYTGWGLMTGETPDLKSLLSVF